MKHCLSSLIALSCFAFAGAAQAAAPNVDAITTEPLHVRGGPAPRAKILDILPPEFPLTVGNCTRAWCQIYYESRTGWTFMPALAFREGTSFYKDPNLGPFAKGEKYKRGRLYQTAYLTPQAPGNNGGAARAGSGGKVFGKLKSLAFGVGKTGLMDMTPVGGALTAASAVKGGLNKAQAASSLAGQSGQLGGLGQIGQTGQAKQTGQINPLSNIAAAAQNNISGNSAAAAANAKSAKPGWWTNNQRPNYQSPISPHLWQKKK